MPEPLEREAFLRRVADAVDLQPHDVGEVLEELNSHLSDAAAAWREAGLEPGDAERRAIRGLGDPQTLGRELGRARHRARYLFAAAGGGIFHAFAFGIWAYLTLWIVVGGLALISLMGTVSLARAMGWVDGNWLTGPSGSLGTVIISTLWFVWAGWILPGRVARSAHRSVRGVQLAVGLIGFAVGTWALWAWIQVDMDPVLALGLPLGPLAFLVAAQHPSGGSSLFPRTTLRWRVAIALAVMLGTAIVGLLTVDRTGNGSMGGGWAPGLAGLGADVSSDPVLAATLFNVAVSPDGEYASGGLQAGAAVVGGVAFDDDASRAAFLRRVDALEVEVLPVAVTWPDAAQPGDLTLVGGPVATSSVRLPVADLVSAVRVDLPTLRTPTQLVAVLVGERPDGTRVVLGFDTFNSPVWHGTLVDWWFTGR